MNESKSQFDWTEGRRRTSDYREVVIVLHSRGAVDDSATHEQRTLILRPPNRRFELDLVSSLRDAGIETIRQGQPKAAKSDEFILAPSIRNGSGDDVFDVLEFALVALANGAIGNATYDAFKRFARSLVERIKLQGWDDAEKPLTDAEAEIWGFAMIARQYDVAQDELKLLSIELDSPNAIVRAQGPDETIYTARIEVLDGLAVLGSSMRELPHS